MVTSHTFLTFLILLSLCSSWFPLLPFNHAYPLEKPASVPASTHPTVPQVAILQMYNGVHFFQRLGDLTRLNKQRYASRHGYEFIESTPHGTNGLFRQVPCDTEGSIKREGQPDCYIDNNQGWSIDRQRAPTFGKIKLTLAACAGRKNWWILWSDADAIIVNQTVKLESIIDDGYDMMMTVDWLMINAGVILWKCSDWNIQFLSKVYDERQFDKARALDQSALQSLLDGLHPRERDLHIKFVPKYALNVYLEEYRPGDFLVHMAGKLYEATENGLYAIANQLDLFSKVEDLEGIKSFFESRYLLGMYSGLCPIQLGQSQHDCKYGDPRRMKLNESLGSMSIPNRYRHVGLRYSWLKNWKDKYDAPDWNRKKKEMPVVEMPQIPLLAAEHDENSAPQVPTARKGTDGELNAGMMHEALSKRSEGATNNKQRSRVANAEVEEEKRVNPDVKPEEQAQAQEKGSALSWFSASLIIMVLLVVFLAGPGLLQKAKLMWKRRQSMRAHKAV